MKTLLRIASYLLVLAVGLGAGFYYGSRINQATAGAFEMAEFGYYAAHMETQFSDGTDATREEAIHTFLALIEKGKTRPHALLTDKIRATDSALAYARLGALAQKRGATQEAQRHLKRAESFCPQIGWQECSAEKIAYVVQHLDKQGIFKEGAKK